MEDKDKIEQESNEFHRKYVPMDFAKLSKMILQDLTKNNQKYKFFQKYKKEDVIKWLNAPSNSEKQLREVSQFLYNASTHYKRLVNYFAKMPLFYYNIKPYGLVKKPNKKMFELNMYKTIDLLENMNIPHEFSKIFTVAFREDVFYGYEYSNDVSYFIQPLDPDYCKISSNEDGVYNIAFDFTFFDTYKDKLNTYASEFKKLYNIYKADRKQRWQELDSENTICIKINEDLDYCIPPFAGVFEYLFDIEDYKSLQKARTEIGNYKLLMMYVPLREDSDTNNDYLVELDNMMYFYDKTAEALPDGVGLGLSPSKMEAFTFNKDTVEKDNVSDAIKAYWNGAGVANSLFGDGANSGATLNLSIKTDESIVFSALRQSERWINRKLKFQNTTYKFKVKMLNITIFNYKDIQDSLLKSAQYGLPVKMDLAVSYGMTPSDIINQTYMENEVLDLVNKWKPLQNSHTQDTGNANGAPTKSDAQIGDSGEKTREDDANANR